MSQRTIKIYLLSCWLPPLTYALASIYVRQYDGWGAWAAAQIFIGPLLLSFIYLLTGAVLTFKLFRSGESYVRLLIATLFSGGLAAWLLLRMLFMEIQRSFF